MPFYTFSCEHCGEQFETRCSVAEKEENKVICPVCGTNELRRVFGNFSVSMKSGGSCDSCNGPDAGCGSGCCGCCH